MATKTLNKVTRWLKKSKGPLHVTTQADANKLLAGSMVALVTRCEVMIKAAKAAAKETGEEPDIHCTVCGALADQFALWDENDAFPLWLCRVVEGVMRDNELFGE